MVPPPDSPPGAVRDAERVDSTVTIGSDAALARVFAAAHSRSHQRITPHAQSKPPAAVAGGLLRTQYAACTEHEAR